MTEVIGVRFKQVGKIYYFSPNGVQMPIGEKVIVETARGIECGEVAIANREIDDEGIVKPLKTVIRIATEEDRKHIEENKAKEKKNNTEYPTSGIAFLKRRKHQYPEKRKE